MATGSATLLCRCSTMVMVHIVPSGMGTDYSYSYRYVELRPGEAYEMFIVGSANSPSVLGGAST